MNPDYKKFSDKIRSGAFWTYIQGWVGGALSFVAGVILARILEPSDFGLFAAVTAYTAIMSQQIRFGVPEALLQSKELESEQWNSAYWMMMAISVLCFICIVIFSEILQNAYQDNRYSNVMYLMSFMFFITPYMSINETLLRRNMEFKIVSIIRLKSSLVGIAASLTGAVFGLKVYSLVLGGVCGTLFSTIQMAKYAPWKPDLSFSFAKVKKLLAYAWHMHLNSSIVMLAGRIDNMIIGKVMDIASLGFYTRAYSLSRLPVTEIGTRLYQLFFSSFSRIQDDHNHTVLMLKKVICSVTTAVYPFLVILALAADSIIFIIYGEKWLASAEPVMIMSIGAFATTISIMLGALSNAQKLARKETPVQITNLILTIIGTLIGANWGLAGIAIAISIKMYIVMFLLMRVFNKSHLAINYTTLFSGALPSVISATVSFIATWIIMNTLLVPLDKYSLLYLLSVSASVLLIYIFTWLIIYLFSRDNSFQQPVYDIGKTTFKRIFN